jgi:hypothetical protein
VLWLELLPPGLEIPEPLLPCDEPLTPDCPNCPNCPDWLPLTPLDGEPTPIVLLLPPCCNATVRESESTMRSRRAMRSSSVPTPLIPLLLPPKAPELPSVVEDWPSVPLLEDEPSPDWVRLVPVPSPDDVLAEEPSVPCRLPVVDEELCPDDNVPELPLCELPVPAEPGLELPGVLLVCA